MIDYTILYRDEMPPPEEMWNDRWELFVSGYSFDERVRKVFDKVEADEKWWLIQPQYDFAEAELPARGSIYRNDASDEALYVNQFFRNVVALDAGTRVCIDISGLMRPHLLYVLRYLFQAGVDRFDVLYSEPQQYVHGADTRFVGGAVNVRQVNGYEGVHIPQTDRDLLVIGAGYDYEQIVSVAYNKEHAHILQMFGLPSLAPDMYQESRLRAKDAEEGLGTSAESPILVAPASDPFVTASVLQETVRRETEIGGLTNLYLCPVGSKPQTLGFGLYYVGEWLGDAASIIFPFSERYEKTTTTGVKTVWKYSVERLT
jgi:hypothetical protein